MIRMFAVVCAVTALMLSSNTRSAQEKPKSNPPAASSKGTKESSEAAAERTASAATREAPSDSAGKLPVRRVVLYKNGVGYFEHLGRVRGSQSVHIDFTSAQLNDVLKSLTVLDLSGGRITGVDYNSEAPLARRLGTLRLALGEKPSMRDFLGALRGARLEVRSGTGPALTGKLMSVERKTRTMALAGTTVETDELSLITDNGEVRSVDLGSSTSVRIVDRDLQGEVGKYLGLIASAREQDVRRMTVSTSGTGERNLYVSYISEVPVWKTTYRIVMPSQAEKKPLLQGWGIVDNTVGEDWDNVELSLVAGAPHSFIQELSVPTYGRRPVVELSAAAQYSPQTHGGTLQGGNSGLTGTVTDQMGAPIAGASVRLMDEQKNTVAQTTTDGDGQYSFPSLPQGNYHLEVQHQGFQTNLLSVSNLAPGVSRVDTQLKVGEATETVEVTAEATSVETSSSAVSGAGRHTGVANRAHIAANTGVGFGAGPMAPPPGMAGKAPQFMALALPNLANARSALESGASGQDLGDLFEYKLKDRVTLKKNQSALVPIAQTEIEAERVSLWNGATGASSGRPVRALWLKNTSPLTLDGGSFSVLEKEVFAGEGLVDAIKPGERRLLSYATDLGLLVEAQPISIPQHVTRVKIAKGTMILVSELQQRTVYLVRNQDKDARTLVVEHATRPGWTLAKGTKEPDERAVGAYRFRMEVASKATGSLPVEEVSTLENRYQLSDLSNEQIQLFVDQRSINAEMKQALDKITSQKAVVAKFEAEMENRQKDIDRIVEDQARLRENMKALRGSAEEKALLQRYTKQLDEQETRLDALRKTIQNVEAQRDAANDQLEKMIGELQMETTV